MTRSLGFVLAIAAAQLTVAGPVAAQRDEAEGTTWRLEGLRTAFCVQLLMSPTSEALKDLPPGYRALPASEATDLHTSLRGVVEGQPEFASWSPSRLCFDAVDTVQTEERTVGSKRGREPRLFASWTVLAAGPDGSPGDVVLELFSNSDHLIHSARLAGHRVREARLAFGLVPVEDENGVPSTDRRFQVKLGKTIVTWDGPQVRDSGAVREPLRRSWSMAGQRGGIVKGEVVISPAFTRPMAGSLKVDGKDDFAKALRASPTRFAGPAYQGGDGTISLHR